MPRGSPRNLAPTAAPRQKKPGSIEWLGEYIDELLAELRALDVFVPGLPPAETEDPGGDTSTGGKGKTEKRTLRGNTKSTKKAMKHSHQVMLERRSI